MAAQWQVAPPQRHKKSHERSHKEVHSRVWYPNNDYRDISALNNGSPAQLSALFKRDSPSVSCPTYRLCKTEQTSPTFGYLDVDAQVELLQPGERGLLQRAPLHLRQRQQRAVGEAHAAAGAVCPHTAALHRTRPLRSSGTRRHPGAGPVPSEEREVLGSRTRFICSYNVSGAVVVTPVPNFTVIGRSARSKLSGSASSITRGARDIPQGERRRRD
ncbi:hypothetical protein EVAR_83733_1 [Eumeta japonica]|uniref:Uncharacterized protein n=1 Tax=Eumeta variegata TaxID=151549 RepID=A0A4C1WAW9_EUMVA|nr:hypothetical protein EVAR_83733_1 [Eumeta japonica]